jgi:uncharacterized protein
VIVVDTGPLVALFDADDKYHHKCAMWFDQVREQLLVPALVVTEVCYLLGCNIGPEAESAFFLALNNPPLVVVPPAENDWPRVAELVDQYADWPLGGVDAFVVAVAERLEVAKIATIDYRHFTALRPRHIPAFNLVL